MYSLTYELNKDGFNNNLNNNMMIHLEFILIQKTNRIELLRKYQREREIS